MMDEFRGKRVIVMGLGLFGGGVGVTRFLVEHGARVTVTDLKPAEELGESVLALRDLDVAFHLGGHREEDFREADVVIVNPAVPLDSPFLSAAKASGALLDTEMNIFFRRCQGQIIGVTGSNGKSTTAALTYEMLRRSRSRAWLGGNIGESLLCRLPQISANDIVVLELSSFQLEHLAWIYRSPNLAVVLNISPNHLDRHKTLEAYVEAKRRIVSYQNEDDIAVLNGDDLELRQWAEICRSRCFFFGTEDEADYAAVLRENSILLRGDGQRAEVPLEHFWLPGPHNRQNAAAAALASFLAGAAAEDMQRALSEFRGLEHRLEYVAEVGGVEYYNDSMATTPESGIAALRAFGRPVVLIAGGYDKGISLKEFAEEAARAKAVMLIGKTAEKLGKLISACGDRTAEVRILDSLEDAVRAAGAVAEPGDVVVLSPACASYDMFRNFVERGKMFKGLVKEMKG